MNIQIESVGFDPSDSLNTLINKKLEGAFDKYEFIHRIKVFLRLEPNDKLHKHKMELSVYIPQKELFAHAGQDRFEKALDDCIGKMRTQLSKAKDKLKEH